VKLISREGAMTPGPGLTWLPDPNAPEGFFGVDRSAPNRLSEPTPEGMGPFVDEEDLAASVQELAAKVAELTAMHDTACRERDEVKAEVEKLRRVERAASLWLRSTPREQWGEGGNALASVFAGDAQARALAALEAK
jgi:hypothetical protein